MYFPFPNPADAKMGVALVIPLYVGAADKQAEAIDALVANQKGTGNPHGFISLSVFASVSGHSILTYAQWESDAAYRDFARTVTPHRQIAEPIRYEYYRGVELEPASTPTVLVPPVFDVQGRDRQHRSADSLVDGPLGRPFPGLVSSHFHTSTDGSRVLNWAYWVDERAHENFMQSPVPGECHRAITMPGVRGLGGGRYRLAHTQVA